MPAPTAVGGTVPDRERRVDLVFEGGGVKGIALAGAVSVLLSRGFEPQNLAGSSGGAITAALLGAGYDADELREIVLELDLRRFRDRGWEDRLPLVDKPASLLLDQGIYEGERFFEWVAALLAAKGVTTFADLVLEEFADDPRYRHSVQVIASDVTGRRLLVLPHDAGELGLDPDGLGVALAVRMSMSIPFFFEPVSLTSPSTGRRHLIVDGGMLSNFPVWLFDCEEGEPDWPTFGLLLVEPDPKTSLGERLGEPERGVGALVDYVRSLAQTMMEAHDRLYVEQAEYARTIAIPTLGVGTTDFGLTTRRKRALYDSGVRAAELFLETWSFDDYIAEFRRGKPHSRRAEVAAGLARRGARADA